MGKLKNPITHDDFTENVSIDNEDSKAYQTAFVDEVNQLRGARNRYSIELCKRKLSSQRKLKFKIVLKSTSSASMSFSSAFVSTEDGQVLILYQASHCSDSGAS